MTTTLPDIHDFTQRLTDRLIHAHINELRGLARAPSFNQLRRYRPHFLCHACRKNVPLGGHACSRDHRVTP